MLTDHVHKSLRIRSSEAKLRSKKGSPSSTTKKLLPLRVAVHDQKRARKKKLIRAGGVGGFVSRKDLFM